MVIYRLHAIRNRPHTTESIKENQMFLKQIVVLKKQLDCISQHFFTSQISHIVNRVNYYLLKIPHSY